jgi:prepilin-type processing-associated H-X9-DG protein
MWWNAHGRYCGRHNGGFRTSETASLAKYQNGDANMEFGDGHVETVRKPYDSLPSDNVKLQGFDMSRSSGF